MRIFFTFLTCTVLAAAEMPMTLEGTKLLDWTGDISTRMHEAAHRDMEVKIEEVLRSRQKLWHRDASSEAAYSKSIEPNRASLRRKLGMVDARVPVRLEKITKTNTLALTEVNEVRIYQVRWTVLEGMDGEGLLLEPAEAKGYVVVLPDADETPEQLCGLEPGNEAQLALRLALDGFAVIVPALVDRSHKWSGHPEFWMTNEPHREWIHRQAMSNSVWETGQRSSSLTGDTLSMRRGPSDFWKSIWDRFELAGDLLIRPQEKN